MFTRLYVGINYDLSVRILCHILSSAQHHTTITSNGNGIALNGERILRSFGISIADEQPFYEEQHFIKSSPTSGV